MLFIIGKLYLLHMGHDVSYYISI